MATHYIPIRVSSDVEYDMKRSGVRILMSSRFNRREVQGLLNIYEPDPEADSKFYLSLINLPLSAEMVYAQMPDLAQREEYLFIPLSKAVGLQWENANSKRLYFIFTPTLRSKKIKVQHPAYLTEYYDCQYIYVTVKKIILAVDDEVIYTRNF